MALFLITSVCDEGDSEFQVRIYEITKIEKIPKLMASASFFLVILIHL